MFNQENTVSTELTNDNNILLTYKPLESGGRNNQKCFRVFCLFS